VIAVCEASALQKVAVVQVLDKDSMPMGAHSAISLAKKTQSNPNYDVKFYSLCCGLLTPEGKRSPEGDKVMNLYGAYLEKNGVKVFTIPFRGQSMKDFPDDGRNKRTYVKFFLDKVHFEVGVNWVIYLDADTAVVGDISRLLKLNLTGKYMAAANLGGIINNQRLNVCTLDDGVVVFNLSLMRNKQVNVFEILRSNAESSFDAASRNLAFDIFVKSGGTFFKKNRDGTLLYGLSFVDYSRCMGLLAVTPGGFDSISQEAKRKMIFTPEELSELRGNLGSSRVLGAEWVLSEFFNKNLSQCVVFDLCFNKTVCSFLPNYGNDIARSIDIALSGSRSDIRKHVCSYYNIKDSKSFDNFILQLESNTVDMGMLEREFWSLSEMLDLWVFEKSRMARDIFIGMYQALSKPLQLPELANEPTLADDMHSRLPQCFKKSGARNFCYVHCDRNYRTFIEFNRVALTPTLASFCGFTLFIEKRFPHIRKDEMLNRMLVGYTDLVRQAHMPAVIWHDEGSPKLFAKRAILLDKYIGLLKQDAFLEGSIEWGIFDRKWKPTLISLIENKRWAEVRALVNPFFTLDQGA
jgi:hypothetical protein